MYFILTNRYKLTTNKLDKDLKISNFADVHYSNIFKKYRFDQIKYKLIKEKPNYICIPGDIIDATNILDETKNKLELLDFFKRVGEIAPTYVSLGSHDFTRLRTKKKIGYEEHLEFWHNDFKQLTNYNVFLLDNEVEVNDNVRFIGYTPTYDYYYNENHHEDEQILINDFNRNIPNITNDKYNILLIHSPICILNDEVRKNIPALNNIDLILTGHMHNGMIPGILTNAIKGNFGLIAPNKSLFPDNARGMKQIETESGIITLIASGGISKIQESAPNILHFGDYIYSPQMDSINIKTKKRIK